MANERVSEPQIRVEILRLMSDGKIWTNAELKKRLRSILPLSADDKARANERHCEEKWEELVNNALAPSRGKSLTHTAQGYVKTDRIGEHEITEAGRDFLAHTELVLAHTELMEKDPDAAHAATLKAFEEVAKGFKID